MLLLDVTVLDDTKGVISGPAHICRHGNDWLACQQCDAGYQKPPGQSARDIKELTAEIDRLRDLVKRLNDEIDRLMG